MRNLIQPINENQRRFFLESYECRTTQIKNLIRSITRCLESEQNRTITGNLESEISRVERNSKDYGISYQQLRDKYEERIERLRNEIRGRIEARYHERRIGIEAEKQNLENEEREFSRQCDEEKFKHETDPEKLRTRIKHTTTEFYRERRESIAIRHRTVGEQYIGKIGKIEAETEQSERDIREISIKSNTTQRYIESESHFICRDRREINEIENSERRVREAIKLESEDKFRLENKIREDEIRIRNEFDENRRKLESKFQELRKDLTNAVGARTYSGNGFTINFKKLLEELSRIPDFLKDQELETR